MKLCEACGRQTPVELTSLLGASPICEICFENFAEPPKQIALAMREIQRTGRDITREHKKRITCHGGNGLYLPLREYYERASKQQIIEIEPTDEELYQRWEREQEEEDLKNLKIAQIRVRRSIARFESTQRMKRERRENRLHKRAVRALMRAYKAITTHI